MKSSVRKTFLEINMTSQRKNHELIQATFNEILSAVAYQNREKIISPTKPFVKWVGGKRSILEEMKKYINMSKFKDNYFEPFVGGGAVFFEIKPKKAYLSDINFHLMVTYQVVRDHLEDILQQIKQHKEKHSQAYYQKVRSELNNEASPVKIAGAFIYLNKTCFNGLYRVNKKGEFNVPIGSYTNPSILDESNLRNCSKALQGTEIYQHDFMKLTPCKNALYYLDPPYHQTYDQYNGAGFGHKDHENLATFCDKINSQGSHFLLSNSATRFVRSLYHAYHMDVVSASRSVSCKGDQRGKVTELIIRNYP